MDKSGSDEDRQIEEFNEDLSELTAFYQRQALIAGVIRARRDWQAMNAPPKTLAEMLAVRRDSIEKAAHKARAIFSSVIATRHTPEKPHKPVKVIRRINDVEGRK